MVEEQKEKKCCEKSGIKYVSAYHNTYNLGKRGFDDRKLGVKNVLQERGGKCSWRKISVYTVRSKGLFAPKLMNG